jgi:hypothetical protein
VSLVCTAGRTVAINAINVAARAAQTAFTRRRRAPRRDAADCVHAARVSPAEGAQRAANSSHNVLAVPRDAHITLTHALAQRFAASGSARRARRRRRPPSIPDHDVVLCRHDSALARHGERPGGAGRRRGRRRRRACSCGARRPPKFVNADLLTLLCVVWPTPRPAEARELRLVTRTVGQPRSRCSLPSQYLPLVHRFVRYLARSTNGVGLGVLV